MDLIAIAKEVLAQMYRDRSAALVETQIKETNPRSVIMYAHEFTQTDNMMRVLEHVFNEGYDAGIHAALNPLIREADHRLKPSAAKTVLEALCVEVRLLKKTEVK